jgi:hypothetical protein
MLIKLLYPSPRRSPDHALVDLASADAVDGQLDQMICKQASQDRRPDPDEQEELWKKSVRAYTASKREELRAEWFEHHQGQAVRLRAAWRS